MGILDISADAMVNAAANMAPPKIAASKPGASVWGSVYRTVNAVPRAITEAVAQGAGSVAETVGGFGQVLGAYPEAFGYSPTGEARQQADTARAKLMRDGVDMNNDIGDSLREAGRSYRPDPATSNVAEQLLYTFARGASKVVAGAVVGGPVGIGAAALEEANTQSEELRAQGVQFGPRVAAGAVQGAGLALAALPLVGNTLAQTAGLYVLGGPGGFMAQQALTREILQNAGQDKVAAQFDPLDPVGLAVSALIPAGFTAYGLRAQRLQRAADSLPPDLATAEGRAPAPDAVPPVAEPFPGVLTPTAAAARYYPPEVVDAAMVTHLAEQRRASNPGDVTIRAADQHEAALTRAEEQIARGEPVQVADVAPEPRVPQIETPEFKAWFGGSRVVDEAGKPIVVYHGTAADIEGFLPNERGIFFGEDPSVADSYSRIKKADGTPNVIPVFLSIKNPWTMIRYGDDVPYSQMVDQSNETLRAKGYDGIYEPERKVWIAFEPSQAKSAIGNSGRFDPNSPSLTDPIEQFANNLRTGLDAMKRELDAAAPVNQGGALRSVAPDTKPPEAAAPNPNAATLPDLPRTDAPLTPRPLLETRGTGVRFHGTSRPIESLNNAYAMSGDSRNIYGQGFYTTDAADISQGYMKKGKGDQPTLYTVTEQPVKMFDMEAPLSDDMRTMLRKTVGDADYEGSDSIITKATSLRDWFDEFRKDSRDLGLSRDAVQEIWDSVRYNLEADGFRGYRHIGGSNTKNAPHEVKIFWYPEQDVTITPANLDTYRKAAPLPRTDAATTQATRAEAATPAGVAGADTSGVPGARAGAVEAGGLTPEKVAAAVETAKSDVIALRKRESVLKSLLECLGA